MSKEESADRKAEALERRENDLTAKETELKKKEKKVDDLHDQEVQELERISGFTSEQAKEYLLKSVEDEVKIDTAKLYKELEGKAKEEAGRKAKDFVVTAIQKCAVDHVAESTISVVQLPSDEMKGRIIGREGRNIRTSVSYTHLPDDDGESQSRYDLEKAPCVYSSVCCGAGQDHRGCV